MNSTQQKVCAGGNAARANPKAEIRAFKLDSDKSNLGKVAVALVNSGYSRGSVFDNVFTHTDIIENMEAKQNEEKFIAKNTCKILHLIVSKGAVSYKAKDSISSLSDANQNEAISYEKLGCDKISFNTLRQLDDAKGGVVMRRKIEDMIVLFAKHIKADEKECIWGVRLLESMSKEGQSLLVLRIQSDAMPGSETNDADAAFFVIATSQGMRKDALAVAEHMTQTEYHPGTWIVMASKTRVMDKIAEKMAS